MEVHLIGLQKPPGSVLLRRIKKQMMWKAVETLRFPGWTKGLISIRQFYVCSHARDEGLVDLRKAVKYTERR